MKKVPRMRNSLLTILFLGMTLAVGSCDRQKVFSRYEHIESSQWEKTDTVHFSSPHMQEAGTYQGTLGLRIESDYPYRELALEVNMQILPSGQTLKRSLNCELIDKSGTIKGSGISQYQYEFPVDLLQLEKDDSLQVTIIHNMRRELMPNICDVGFTLTRK